MKTTLTFSLQASSLRVGLVEALDIRVKPSSDAYRQQIRADIAPMLAPGFIYPDSKQKGIRSLLKITGFHPSGRSRPASEFLFKDINNRGCFNFINNVVDINNHLSLVSHLPISVFDLDKSGYQMSLRVGFDDESYVFNREGQTLSLKKLLVAARANADHAAFGSPVKDSQATKVFEETTNIAAIIYTSSSLTPEDELNELLTRFAELLKQETEAKTVEACILNHSGPL